MLGLRAGGLRLPLVEATDRERAQLREALERRGLIPAVPAGEVAHT